MAKQREVEKQHHGYYKGYEYEKAKKEAKAADQASYGTVRPAPRDPEFAAQLDRVDVVCCGCCFADPENDAPENNSCCTIM
jgi:hypothetical protein